MGKKKKQEGPERPLTRMRTLDGCIKQMREDDPNTSFTRHALRLMVLSGQVPYVKVGAGGGKYLVNYDRLLAILSGDDALCEDASDELRCGHIRRIP